MPIKEIVCDSCEASFTIEYEMLGTQYLVRYCPFCGSELEEEFTFGIQSLKDKLSAVSYLKTQEHIQTRKMLLFK